MKRAWLIILMVALACGVALPQASASGQKTLAATMNVYVFPTTGQTPEVQSQDEAACYTWAVQNVGTDPFELSKQSQAQAQQTEQAKQQAAQVGRGSGASGALRGAAAGALIGEIANDDAGQGAAYGAAAGMIRGRRRGRKAQSSKLRRLPSNRASRPRQQQRSSWRTSRRPSASVSKPRATW